MCFQHLIFVLLQIFLNSPKDDSQTRETESLTARIPDDDDDDYEPELNKQMRILITRLATSVMIFAVIRQSLDHAYLKNQPSRLIGVSYTDPSMQELMKAKIIDGKTQNYCFIMSCLFFVDFISAWFDSYSKYFAGNRFEKVSNILERAIQKLYDVKIVFIVVGILSEAYLMG